MVSEFSPQTAIVGTFGSSMVLAATLYYLWWQDRTQRALYSLVAGFHGAVTAHGRNWR